MTIVSIEDLRLRARRRLPKVVFDFIDGGAADETTLAANRADFERIGLVPRMLVDVSRRDLSTTLFGRRLDLPLILAPTGLTGLTLPRGEAHAARAAEEAGIVYALSTTSTMSIEDVAASTGRPCWFQLYVMKDRELTRALLERAKRAGYEALLLTVDLPVAGRRERDVRNGFSIPPRVSLGNVLEVLARPRWLKDRLLGPPLTFANFRAEGGVGGFIDLARHVSDQFDQSVTWRDVEWVKSVWGGPVVVKGVLTGDDARRAIDHGADGVSVSNHGGRQLDGAPSAIAALPEVVAAIGGRAPVLLDSGVRRGTDILKAVALGATAVMIGRPFLYGLAALGPTGATRAIQILRDELDNALALIGAPSVATLDASYLRMR